MKVERPNRVEYSYKQRICAPPSRVFPLLCPVREVEWADGWMPLQVISTSGLAETGCIFTTLDGDEEAIWIITQHDARSGAIDFVKTQPARAVTEISIRLREASSNETEADVTYRFTAISEKGKRFVSTRTADWYERFMKQWERELNGYLRGK